MEEPGTVNVLGSQGGVKREIFNDLGVSGCLRRCVALCKQRNVLLKTQLNVEHVSPENFAYTTGSTVILPEHSSLDVTSAPGNHDGIETSSSGMSYGGLVTRRALAFKRGVRIARLSS